MNHVQIDNSEYFIGICLLVFNPSSKLLSLFSFDYSVCLAPVNMSVIIRW